jgi:hypothetical protein
MDKEQILFLVIAIGFSIFSLYMKSKKQKKQEPYDTADDVTKSPQNEIIFTKKKQNKSKLQNIAPIDISPEASSDISQNTDLESDIELLPDFEGTEIQKAFLYSELFKHAKN